jgi:hypothetical protein
MQVGKECCFQAERSIGATKLFATDLTVICGLFESPL